MPVYKPDKGYLREVLASIYAQEYSNIELIISLDEELPKEWWEAETQILLDRINFRLVLNNDATGIFSNINNALVYSSGEFIQLFSQDDRMFPCFIQEQVSTLIRFPAVGMVFSAFDVIDEQGRDINHAVNFAFKPKKDLHILSSEAPYLFLQYGCLPGNISPVMIRKTSLMSTGLFDTSLPFAGDFDYWVRLSGKHEMHYLSKSGLQVRKHNKQASLTISNRQLLQDLVHVYRGILTSIPNTNIKSGIRRINQKVGPTFIHHVLKSVLLGKSKISEIKERWSDLDQYPFNPLMSASYYVLSIPSRVWRNLF